MIACECCGSAPVKIEAHAGQAVQLIGRPREVWTFLQRLDVDAVDLSAVVIESLSVANNEQLMQRMPVLRIVNVDLQSVACIRVPSISAYNCVHCSTGVEVVLTSSVTQTLEMQLHFGEAPVSLRDWFADVLNLPAHMGENLLALRQLANGVQRVSERQSELQKMMQSHESAPRLATLTVLCERSQPKADGHGIVSNDEREWVPSCLGAEHWLHVGECYDLLLDPYYEVRNLRWFVSGDPSIVVSDVKFGVDHVGAAYGGMKFGDAPGPVRLGHRITVTIQRRRVPS